MPRTGHIFSINKFGIEGTSGIYFLVYIEHAVLYPLGMFYLSAGLSATYGELLVNIGVRKYTFAV